MVQLLRGERPATRFRVVAALIMIALVAAACSASATTVTQTDPVGESAPTQPAAEESTPATPTETAADADPTAVPEPPATAVPVPPTPEPSPAVPVAPVDDALVWTPCPGGECTTVTVPLDYDEPTGATIDVAVARRPAANQQERIGPLFVNFGGPGGESTAIFNGAGPTLGSVFPRFDIVTWDPRGIGQTARLACDALGNEFPTVELDPSDGLDDEIAEQEAEFAEVVACAATSGPIVDHLGTVNVARDMEAVRVAIGDEPMNYLGFSYGTQIGWVYATLFGDAVRSMILDGAVPGGAISAADFTTQLAAFQRTFDYFDDICDREPTCLQRDEGLTEAVERIASDLEQDPIVLSDGSLFGDVEFRQAILFSLYQRADTIGPLLTTWIDDIDNGDANGFLRLLDSGSSNATPGGYQAVLCADGGAFPGPGGQAADYESTLAASETFGILGEIVRCDLWQGEVELPPEIDTAAAATILVIGNTFDPATPYESAVLLDEQLANSVLVTVDAGGHTAVLDDRCSGQIAVTYVNELIPPAEGTVCITPGFFGVGLSELGGNSGVRIDSVGEGSAAEAAGVQPGDILLDVDGTPIVQARDIPAVEPDTPSEWTLFRDGEEFGLVLRPVARPWN